MNILINFIYFWAFLESFTGRSRSFGFRRYWIGILEMIFFEFWCRRGYFVLLCRRDSCFYYEFQDFLCRWRDFQALLLLLGFRICDFICLLFLCLVGLIFLLLFVVEGFLWCGWTVFCDNFIDLCIGGRRLFLLRILMALLWLCILFLGSIILLWAEVVVLWSGILNSFGGSKKK